jgi:membrane protease YdiL (CAAX protease family)
MDPGSDRSQPTLPEADGPPSVDDARAEPAHPGTRGSGAFEGRAAPGLFVVAWLATILGIVATFIGLAAAPSAAKVAVLFGGLITLAVGLVAGAGSQAMERRARGAPFSGPSPFLTFAASIPITLAVANLVALPFLAAGADAETPLTALATVTVTSIVYYVLVRLLVVDHGALSWSEMGVGQTGRAAIAELLTGAVYALPAILATGVVAVALSGVLPTPPAPLPLGADPVGILANLLAAAVVAPLGEELFFRGYATTAWERGTGPRRALVQGALFFAFVHVLAVTGATAAEAAGAAVAAFLARLPISFMLGWIFLRRGSLWASIGLHSAFNLALVVLAIAAGGAGAVSGVAFGW